MKSQTEIFRVKFSKYINEQGIPCYMMYTLGGTGIVDGELLTPKKITIVKQRVRVEFEELGIIHEFAFTDDVEIYRRDKIQEDAKETTD